MNTPKVTVNVNNLIFPDIDKKHYEIRVINQIHMYLSLFKPLNESGVDKLMDMVAKDTKSVWDQTGENSYSFNYVGA